MTPDAMVAEARAMIGTPFIHQGRAPGTGLDCIGLLVCAAESAGYRIRDRRAYGRRPNPRQLLEAFEDNFEQAPPTELRTGDILLFCWRQTRRHGRLPQHAGIVTNRGHGLLHAYDRVGRVVETGLDERWTSRVHSAWRLPEWRQS